MNDFFSSHRFPPRVPKPFPFNTSVMYRKTVFVEFTDQLFNIAKPRPPWMGNVNKIDSCETGCLISLQGLPSLGLQFFKRAAAKENIFLVSLPLLPPLGEIHCPNGLSLLDLLDLLLCLDVQVPFILDLGSFSFFSLLSIPSWSYPCSWL